MLQFFANARAWLANIDPALPAATLVLLVFLAVYSVRRWLPSVWKVVEATVPFAGSLDPGPVLNAVWKSWQVLPGALFGAAVSALASGLSVKTALYGVAAGAAASLAHELMAAYRGQVAGRKTPKPPSVPPFAAAGLLLFALTVAASCTPSQVAAEKQALADANSKLNQYCDARANALEVLQQDGGAAGAP